MKNNTRSSLIWLRMLHFTNYSNRLSNEFLKPFGLTAAKFDLLVQIKAHQPITQMALAEKLLLTQAGISKMLSRLQDEQLICKTIHWKEKEITLTEHGEQLLAEVMPKQLAFQSAFFEDTLDEAEIKTLYQLMTKVTKRARKKSKAKGNE